MRCGSSQPGPISVYAAQSDIYISLKTHRGSGSTEPPTHARTHTPTQTLEREENEKRERVCVAYCVAKNTTLGHNGIGPNDTTVGHNAPMQLHIISYDHIVPHVRLADLNATP